MNHDEAHSCVSSNIAQAAHRCLFFAPRSSMGKLIKNHWARLIILTSACCESEELQDIDTPTANPSTRPTSRRNRRLLLAQILLRFPDQELRHRRKTRSDPASHQRRYRTHLSRLRVAIKMGSGDTSTQKHSGEAAVVTTGYLERCAAISNHKRGTLLPHRMRCIFLGL